MSDIEKCHQNNYFLFINLSIDLNDFSPTVQYRCGFDQTGAFKGLPLHHCSRIDTASSQHFVLAVSNVTPTDLNLFPHYKLFSELPEELDSYRGRLILLHLDYDGTLNSLL